MALLCQNTLITYVKKVKPIMFLTQTPLINETIGTNCGLYELVKAHHHTKSSHTQNI